ncbi:MAG: alanine:cation symporter family protein, partial [Bacilli bacterium]
VKYYKLIALAFIIIGSALKIDLVWELADLFNGIMVVPNLIALILLSNQVVFEVNTYYNQSL